ncbi:unnamed protein product [Lactuca virosa]|uniref:ALA-interacting subunit n=1 Tax=Lactuca virosa TaxID=75947 RepID=A0AAU9PI30_9ASTR|nr:unnamed protein product [Lactuca virosa]
MNSNPATPMNANAPSSSSGGAGSPDSTAPRRNSKRPKYSRFTQQELPACKPILTPKWVISAFMLVTIVFIPIGLASLFASRDVVEIIDRTLTVTKRMKQPIYVYYQLDNYYQNHRRYVKSRSDQQLRNRGDENDTSSCKPEHNANGMPIVPCGLVAWSLFNDTYAFSTRNNQSLPVNKRHISWKSDREDKFGRDVFPKNFQNGSLILVVHISTSPYH